MNLKNYLDIKSLSIYRFSKTAGIARQAITKFLSGKGSITVKTAYRFHLATNKEVSMQEMLTPEEQAKIESEVK